tara:strand:- start:1 stop:192 length:192 start_codon:yes stop_codon:yes gene_type:complete
MAAEADKIIVRRVVFILFSYGLGQQMADEWWASQSTQNGLRCEGYQHIEHFVSRTKKCNNHRF